MKSRRDCYETRKVLMIAALLLYTLAALLLGLCFVVNGWFATIAVILSLVLLGAVMCSLYAARQKDYLFCPKCGSKNVVKTGLFGIPASITDECPDCHKKINIEKSIRED